MKHLLKLMIVLFCTATFGQAGHIMQGVGAVNMSMGGAATAMPLDISGALHWNPASISTFDGNIFDFNIGAFYSSPELSSSSSTYGVSGITKDDRGVSPMPSFAYVWGNQESKHTFGLSAFAISGFGVTFPQKSNNPISNPQPFGFGHIESDYMLLQIGFAYSYEIVKGFSIGLQPNIDLASLKLEPSPLSIPNSSLGYPGADKAFALGYGAQVGLFFESKGGVKLGASYKTAQKFSDFTLKNTYLDGTEAPDVDFRMDYPAIISFGVGYSTKDIDITADFRHVNYDGTEGFEKKGWNSTGSVKGFGWKDMAILSAGIQFKCFEKFPIRLGYTHSTNPIDEELAFFSVSATGIIKNAYQIGLGYNINDKFKVNSVFHYGTSGGKTEGSMLSSDSTDITNYPPYGAIPGTSVGYEMTTMMIMAGITYSFNK